MGLINATVSKEDQVEKISILNPYNQKKSAGDKLTILDIKAKSTSGKWFNIEMQINDDAEYKKRSLYYWAKLYSDQLNAGQSYDKLEKTISIHLLNFEMLDESDYGTDYHNVFKVKHEKTNLILTDMLELHYIELKKIPKDLKNIKTTLDFTKTIHHSFAVL